MKIAYLTLKYSHHQSNHSSGICSSVYSLDNTFVKLGHEVRVLIY